LKQGEIGGQHRSIINVTSSNAVAVSISRGEYCVSKSASSMTTRLFGVRLAAEGHLTYTVGQAVTVDGGLTIPRF
jgi:3-oxoacyl-[acyl-carrier protein] reductase